MIVEPPADLLNCAEHGERKLIGYDAIETLVMQASETLRAGDEVPEAGLRGGTAVRRRRRRSGRPDWSKAIATTRASRRRF